MHSGYHRLVEHSPFIQKISCLFGGHQLCDLHDHLDEEGQRFSQIHWKDMKWGEDRQNPLVEQFDASFSGDQEWERIYDEMVNDIAAYLFRDETTLYIQRRPNLRIQFPNMANTGRRAGDPQDGSVVGLHNDLELGHPESETNFVFACTDMYDSNSIRYEPMPQSELEFGQYKTVQMRAGEIFWADFVSLKHYNSVNMTPHTRVSLDFRIIPASRFVSVEGDKFTDGPFFRKFSPERTGLISQQNNS